MEIAKQYKQVITNYNSMGPMEMIDAKLRQVGNAVGVILPKSVLEQENLHVGETVSIGVSKKRKIDVRKLLGLAKGAAPFERDHEDRKF